MSCTRSKGPRLLRTQKIELPVVKAVFLGRVYAIGLWQRAFLGSLYPLPAAMPRCNSRPYIQAWFVVGLCIDDGIDRHVFTSGHHLLEEIIQCDF